jgi:hypothetical protein
VIAYLNLKDVVTPNPLVVHVVVRIIGIATILVLHERKPRIQVRFCCLFTGVSLLGLNLQPAASRARGRDITPDQSSVAV